MSKFYTSYLSLGSNLSNKHLNLKNAVSAIDNTIAKVTDISEIYETPSWGFEGENFYNICIKIKTSLTPEVLLTQLLVLEKKLGRKEKQGLKYEDRPIDIDILLYEQKKIDTEFLQIPHPRALDRNFVLVPLLDIYNEEHFPFTKDSLNENIDNCTDESPITRTGLQIDLTTVCE